MRMVGGRPWYEDQDMEDMTEEALRGAAWPREGNGKAVDIDRVVSKHLRIQPVLADLEAGILGQTRFRRNGPPIIEISKTLADEAAASNRGAFHRYRTTLAHEASHVLFHSCLYVDSGESLFGEQAEVPFNLCRGGNMGRFVGSDWKEVQANLGMACLLLPRIEVIKEIRENASLTREELIIHLSKTFLVSPEAARYRFEKFSPAASDRQGMLL